MIKGFSLCVGWWQFHSHFSRGKKRKEREKAKVLLTDVAAQMQPFQLASMKSRTFCSITPLTSTLCGFAIFSFFRRNLFASYLFPSAGTFSWRRTWRQIKAFVSCQRRGRASALMGDLKERQGSYIVDWFEQVACSQSKVGEEINTSSRL